MKNLIARVADRYLKSASTYKSVRYRSKPDKAYGQLHIVDVIAPFERTDLANLIADKLLADEAIQVGKWILQYVDGTGTIAIDTLRQEPAKKYFKNVHASATRFIEDWMGWLAASNYPD
jgi:hypothetical protein